MVNGKARDLARKIVGYSLEVGERDVVLINVERAYLEYGHLIAEEVERAGASHRTDYFGRNDKVAMINRGDGREMQKKGEELCALAEGATHCVSVCTPVKLKSRPDANNVTYQRNRSLYTDLIFKPYLKACQRINRRNATVFPSKYAAIRIGRSFKDYERMVYAAGLVDESQLVDRMNCIGEIFDDADSIRIIVGNHTDLSFSLVGRGGINGDGKINVPDGERYISPIAKSVEGQIVFQHQSIWNQTDFGRIKMVFKNGRVNLRDSMSEREPEAFQRALKKKGGRSVGEFGIGFNQCVPFFTGEPRFDEKMNGTIHLATGYSHTNGLRHGGGRVKGEEHWDHVCDMRGTDESNTGRIEVEKGRKRYCVKFIDSEWKVES